MLVEFHANGCDVYSDGSKEQKAREFLLKQLQPDSEFAKKHNFDNSGMMEFKNHLSKKNIKIEGPTIQDIMLKLDNEVEKFTSVSAELTRAGKGLAAGAAILGLAYTAATVGNVIKENDDKSSALQIINQSTSAPKIFFPEKLLEIDAKDRADSRKIKSALGENIKKDAKGEYFTMIFRSPGEKEPSAKKYYLNDPEQLQEAFQKIGIDKKRTANR